MLAALAVIAALVATAAPVNRAELPAMFKDLANGLSAGRTCETKGLRMPDGTDALVTTCRFTYKELVFDLYLPGASSMGTFTPKKLPAAKLPDLYSRLSLSITSDAPCLVTIYEHPEKPVYVGRDGAQMIAMAHVDLRNGQVYTQGQQPSCQ